MERRTALKLLSLELLSSLPVNFSFQSSDQIQKESADLVRKIADYMIEKREVPNPKIEFSHYNDCPRCGELVYMKTGLQVPGSEISRFYQALPEHLQGESPEKLMPNVKFLWFANHQVEVDRNLHSVSFELKVYCPDEPDGYKKRLNWNDPKNYFQIGISGREISGNIILTDGGIDGIVDESINVPVTDRQRVFLESLRRVDRLYNPLLLQKIER